MNEIVKKIYLASLALVLLLLTSSIAIAADGSGYSNAILLSDSASGSVSQGQSMYYKFHANSGQQVTISLQPASASQDLWVYNPSQTEIGYSEFYGTNEEIVTFTAQSTGYHYAAVYGRGAGSYDIHVSFSTPSIPPPAGGDSFANAITITGTRSGSVYQGQCLFYKFNADAGQQVTISLRPASGDPDIYVYDTSQSRIGYSDNFGTDEEVFTFTAGASGYHYVKVHGYQAGSYDIVVTSGATTAPSGDSFTDAITLTDLASGAVSQHQSMYYKFHADSGQQVTVILQPTSTDQDLYVYDPSQNEIDYSRLSGTEADIVTFTAQSTGYHYAMVYGWKTGSYDIEVSFDDAYYYYVTTTTPYDGDSFENAIPLNYVTIGGDSESITFGTPMWGTQSVSDGQSIYYKFNVDNGQRVEVSLQPDSGD